jgi:hypothetical protein
VGLELDRHFCQNRGLIFFPDRDFSTLELDEYYGFGSAKSLKRAVLTKTGLSFPDYRKQLRKSK